MERITVTTYRDDSIQDVIERIQTNVLESDFESITYSFIHAERLDDAQEEN